MSEDAVQTIADRLERTLGRMLELYELSDADRQALARRVDECVENVASIAHAVQVYQSACETTVAALTLEVAELTRRLDHVHSQALRALTHNVTERKPA